MNSVHFTAVSGRRSDPCARGIRHLWIFNCLVSDFVMRSHSRGGDLIKFASRLSDLQPIWTSIQRGQRMRSLRAALARVFRAADARLGLCVCV